jgi:hypothetical protein
MVEWLNYGHSSEEKWQSKIGVENIQKEGEVERYKIEKSLKKKISHWQEDTKIQK